MENVGNIDNDVLILFGDIIKQVKKVKPVQENLLLLSNKTTHVLLTHPIIQANAKK